MFKKETNTTPPTGKKQRFFSSKKGKRLIAAALIVVVAVGGYLWWQGKKATPAAAQTNLTEFTVARGNVTKTVSGSGSVAPVKTYTVATRLTGDILADYFEEGDEVAKDSVLYLLDEDSSSMNMDQVKDSVETAQDNYTDALKDLGDLTTYAKQSGIITNLYISVGDQVSANTKVAEVIDTSRLLLTVPFNAADAAYIRAGDYATVYLDDYGLAIDGRVQKVGSGANVSSTSAVVTYIEIVFDNPGALAGGGYGTAVVGEYACNNEGMTDYAVKDILYASGSGKVISLYVKEGDKINRGDKILTAENSTLADTASKRQKSLDSAEKKLTDARDNLEITSPIAGTVLAKNSKAGDTLTDDSTTMAIVADMSRLIFTIDVDELEIRYLQVGQEAVVTADAYENEVFVGIVTNVGKTGTSTNGVTTYTVKIEIEEYGDLLPGMNVDAEIVIESVENVLYIPLDAVKRGNMVLVKDNGTNAASTQAGAGEGATEGASGQPIVRGNADAASTQVGPGTISGAGEMQPMAAGFMGAQAPAGYSYRQVETGVSSSDFVEIKSGLEEGEIIGYTPATNTDGNFNMMMGPGGGVVYTTTTGPRPAGGVRQGGN